MPEQDGAAAPQHRAGPTIYRVDNQPLQDHHLTKTREGEIVNGRISSKKMIIIY